MRHTCIIQYSYDVCVPGSVHRDGCLCGAGSCLHHPRNERAPAYSEREDIIRDVTPTYVKAMHAAYAVVQLVEVDDVALQRLVSFSLSSSFAWHQTWLVSLEVNKNKNNVSIYGVIVCHG